MSVKTASNVVNGYAHVAARTRERVQRAIDDLGYRPNLTARNLRGGRTGIVALAVPDLSVPYFAELAGWVIGAAARRGWTVVVEQTDGLLEREVALLEGPASLLVDGVLLSPVALGAEELRRRSRASPLVLLGERIAAGAAPVADHVTIDNAAAAQVATAHLLDMGRERVAALGAQPRSAAGTAQLRLGGHARALALAGREVDPALVATCARWDRGEGRRAMAQLLDGGSPPDAVFCFNDLLALGALRELAVRGVRVPEDVAVVGFDDAPDGEFAVPSLTTIAPDKPALAAAAADLLADRLDGERGSARPPERVVVGSRLVVRESTVGAGGAARA